MSDSSQDDGSDEQTVRVERAGQRSPGAPEKPAATDAGAPADESTVLSARGRAEDPDATMPSSDASGASTPAPEPGPRRRGAEAASQGAEPDDGSTMVVRRESRRRAARAEGAAAQPEPLADALASTSAADLPAQIGRIAQAPDDEAAYAPRTAEPARAVRAPAPARPPQDPADTAAIQASLRARARRRAVLVLVAASVVLAVAITAIILLSTSA